MHSINGRLLGQSPWRWQDGVVEGINGLWIHVGYLVAGSVRIWHREDLGAELAVSDPIRVHERHIAGDRWLAGLMADGLGPVRVPTHSELWRSDATPVIVDVGTGRGFPVRDKGGQPLPEPKSVVAMPGGNAAS